MIHAFWATYGAVFVAEIVGGKFLYTTGILATRYRTPPMILGIALAFMVKMGVAVAIGDAIRDLPRLLFAGIAAAGVVWVAVKFWCGYEEGADRPKAHGNLEAAMVSFASVLSSEWGDLGQLTTVAMVIQFRAPLFVWAGAVCAMLTKAVLVATVGAELRGWLERHVPPPVIRYGGLTLLLLVGGRSIAEAFLRAG